MSQLLIILLGIILLMTMVVKKLNPMLALLIVSVVTGLLLGMPVTAIIKSINDGVGSTLGSLAIVLGLGAMIGKLAEDSGAAQKMVSILTELFGTRNIQWAVLITGILVGIPLFYNAGFVVLIPLVFAIASAAGLPILYVGIPMAASLSVTHGFLPPHPGPVALAAIFKADIGKILIYGLLLTIPIAIIAGIIFPRLIIKTVGNAYVSKRIITEDRELPPAFKSFLIALMPVVLIAVGTIGTSISPHYAGRGLLVFLSDPTIALLISLIVTVLILDINISAAMNSCTEGVKSVAMIILIIAAGGAFKQILVDSGVGDSIREYSASINLSPLLLGWLITALLRVTLGSATVAGLTASGIILPLLGPGVSKELMVLSVGAGSLFCSHVNDTGFWMFKEYFGLSLKETFKTWTVMESIISILGLVGVLLLDIFLK
jgi:gluconate transporter